MAFFEWDASLDVGVDAMNEEHKVLIGLMDKLYAQNEAGTPKAELLASAQEMLDYTVKHFQDEEDYMQSIGFPSLAVHKQFHANLLKELDKHVDNFKRGESGKFSSEFTTFLKFWLSTHIRGIDTRYGMYTG